MFFFAMLPFTAWLAGVMGKGEGHLSPWKYVYAGLIYLASVPGIFAITLGIYQFLFERKSLLQVEIFTQLLPIASMILTLTIIRRSVDLDDIPGFDKLSGLVMMITAALGVMWIVDRSRILIFSYIRIEVVLLIFVALLLVIRFGWARMVSR